MARVALLSLAAAAVLLPLALPVAESEPAHQIPSKVWNGARAMGDIAALLKFTPRSLDQPGHQRAIDYIKAELAKTKAKTIRLQQWTYRGNDGSTHAMTNIIASLDPDNPRRIIVATHYDSIVRAYADKHDPQAPMPGANNSASGVALLIETARALSTLPAPPAGIDFIFFDGEEGPKSLGAGDPDWIALGSPYFAAHLAEIYKAKRPEKGVVFDMVCFKNLELNPELSSLFYAQKEVTKFWDIGKTIAPAVFLAEPLSTPIGDDQIALSVAGIPSFLVIDFKYDPWFNTSADTLDKCSAASLDAVGRTLLQYLYAE
jgi:hypothetical protein